MWLRGMRGLLVMALSCTLVTLLVSAPAARAVSLFPGENVTVSGGTLQGVLKPDHREFLGVPYAAPPTGARRFAAPAAPASWTGERQARSKSAPCPQSVPAAGIQFPGSSEDCLYLDVYTPPASSPSVVAKKTPVMVWIYGGAYALGATNQYDPTPLTTKGGVIVVEINYRVGPFGFLALPGLAGKDGAVGNYGLLDQQAGLRWVKQNIAAFGGDPGNVTVFGESAGGNSVCQQLTSPASTGLFQRAIVQSGACGAALLNGQSRAAAYTSGQAYAQETGCADPATMVSCLRAKSPADLLKPSSTQFNSMKLGFVPTVDGVTVPGRPDQLFAAGRYHKVPIMIGGQRDEGRLFVALFHHLFTLSRVTPAQYEADVRDIFGASAPRILAQYPAAKYASLNAESATDLALAQVWTDGLFACSYVDAVQALKRQPGQKLYSYEFTDPNPPAGLADPLMPLGDFHGSDLFYLFSQNFLLPVFLDSTQQRLADRMTGYWTSFARTGDPNSGSLPGAARWPEFTSLGGSGAVMPLSSADITPTSLTSFQNAHQCAFWRSLG